MNSKKHLLAPISAITLGLFVAAGAAAGAEVAPLSSCASQVFSERLCGAVYF